MERNAASAKKRCMIKRPVYRIKKFEFEEGNPWIIMYFGDGVLDEAKADVNSKKCIQFYSKK